MLATSSTRSFCFCKVQRIEHPEVRPNKSFKPSPLRGLVQVLIFSLAQGRKTARLNSGVRPVQKQRPVNKREANVVFVLPRIAQAFESRHKLRAG